MSRQLAIAAAVSVMLMAAFALFDPHSPRASLGSGDLVPSKATLLPSVPDLPRLLPIAQ